MKTAFVVILFLAVYGRYIGAQEDDGLIAPDWNLDVNDPNGFNNMDPNIDPNTYFSNDIQEYVDGESTNGDDRISMKPMETALITIYSIITVVGLIANAVVFFVIFAGNETGKTVTAIYVLQLTIADTIFLFTLPIFSMQKVKRYWAFGSAVCTLCQTIKFMNYYAGIFFLTAMSVDRYVAVAYSTRMTQVRTKKRTYIICACMWLAAVLMSVPLMLYTRTEEGLGVEYCRVIFPGYLELNESESYIDLDEFYGESGYGSSGAGNNTNFDFVDDYYAPSGMTDNVVQFICEFKSQSIRYKSWLVVNFVVAFLIPFAVIVVSYVKILTHLKTSEEKIGHTATSRAVMMRKRVTKMVAALVVCFTICWLPHHLLMQAKIRGFPSTVPACNAIEEFFIALAFSNSALNPILYTFMGNNFSERFRKSVRNTHLAVKRRTSSRGSVHRRSNSHSDPATARKLSALIVHYRKGSSNGSAKDSSQNGKPKPQKKFSQIALLSSRRERPPSYEDVSYGDGSQRADNFYATTTIADHTVETKLDN